MKARIPRVADPDDSFVVLNGPLFAVLLVGKVNPVYRFRLAEEDLNHLEFLPSSIIGINPR